MDIRTIFDDNINEYADHVDKDVAENMSRIYYRGMAGHDPDDNSLWLCSYGNLSPLRMMVIQSRN